MSFQKLEGVVPPLITPFTEDGEVDKKKLRFLVNFLAHHVHGLFVCGSYGCGPLMTEQQRKACVSIVAEEVARKITIIVHVGSANTATSVSLAKHAEEIGAYRVASVAPYYYSHTEERIVNHFKRLVDAVNIPVYIYNNPRTVGYAITPETLAKLEEIGVAGVKDSSFDLMTFSDFIRKTGESFDVVLGTEALFLPAYVLGAKAFIPGLGNAFPEIVVKLYQACIKGNFQQAKEIQFKVLRLRDVMKIGGSTIISVYEMLRLRGIDAGVPRLPFFPLDQKRREQIRRALEDLKMLEENK